MRNRYLFLISFFLFFSFCSQPHRQPDEVRVRLETEPQTLNPVNYTDQAANQILNLLFQSLLSADLADDQLKPVLAKELPLIEQKDTVTLITYEIREEAKWADGSPVTATDVAFTLKVLKAPLLQNEQIKPQVAFIHDLKPDPKNKRRFTLICEEFTPEMELLSGDFFILPAYLFDPENLLQPIPLAAFTNSLSKLQNNNNLKAFAARFNIPEYSNNGAVLQGSAGYTLEKWVPGQYITLNQKQNWWGNNTGATNLTANPERIILQVIPDNNTALLALKNRQLDVLEDIPATEFNQLKTNKDFIEDYNLYTPQAYSAVYTGINSRLPKFKDKATRQAIAYLMDVANFIKVTQLDYATPTVGIVPPNLKKYYNNKLQPYTLNPTKATNLLKSSGWVQRNDGWYRKENGKEQKLTITVSYKAGDNVIESTALIFQQSAAKLNIPVQLQAEEGSMFTKNMRNQAFELFFRTLNGNPFAFNFSPLLHTSYAEMGGTNYTGFGNTDTDALLNNINKATTTDEKAIHLKELQRVMLDEATFLVLYYQKERLAIHNRFDNVKVSGLSPNYDVSAFTLSK